MIAIDTSFLIAYLSGGKGKALDAVDLALDFTRDEDFEHFARIGGLNLFLE